MNVRRSILALFFSAAAFPSSFLTDSTMGLSLLSSHQERYAPPISIGNVAGVGRYIPKPNDVPIPVAHSAKAPRAIPRSRALQLPWPSASMVVKYANAFAWGASSSIVPSARSLDRNMATPAPRIAPGTTPMMLPLEMWYGLFPM